MEGGREDEEEEGGQVKVGIDRRWEEEKEAKEGKLVVKK